MKRLRLGSNNLGVVERMRDEDGWLLGLGSPSCEPDREPTTRLRPEALRRASLRLTAPCSLPVRSSKRSGERRRVPLKILGVLFWLLGLGSNQRPWR